MRSPIFPAVFLCLAACSEGEPAFVRLVTEADLKEGVDTTARVGDILLDNGKVRFAFQAPGSSDTFNLWGGSLVDMHFGEGDDRLEEAFVQCDLRAFAPESFEIIQEGDSKTPAILRFVGKDGGVPHLDSLLPRPPLDAEITVDWTLEPESTTVQIDIRVKDLRKTAPREIACGLLLFEGDRYDTYAPEGGFEPRGGEVSYLAAFAGEAETSWVLRRDGGELSMFGFPPIKIAGNESEVFLANSTHEERYFLSLGTGDLAGLQRQEGLQPEGAVGVGLSIGAALPTDVPVWFTVFDPEAPASRTAKTLARAKDGVASIDVPPGAYEAEIFIDGLSFGRRPFTVSSAGETIVFDADVGQLSLTIREIGLDGTPRDRPGRLVLRNTAGEEVIDDYSQVGSWVIPRWESAEQFGALEQLAIHGTVENVMEFSVDVEIVATSRSPLDEESETYIEPSSSKPTRSSSSRYLPMRSPRRSKASAPRLSSPCATSSIRKSPTSRRAPPRTSSSSSTKTRSL